ncbi:hypothetical protein ACFYRY_34355 [Streptomyces sp. NPDC005263]|uniref:hypothetical protein n=1 Tax=Streptomyces sp. NPDC005263 TaxID=3364711 RepID=UPI00367F6719
MLRIIDARTGEPVDAAPARRGLTRVVAHAVGHDTTALRVLLVADVLVRALEMGGTPVWALLGGRGEQPELTAAAAALGIRPFEDSWVSGTGPGEAQVLSVVGETTQGPAGSGTEPDPELLPSGVRVLVAPADPAATVIPEDTDPTVVRLALLTRRRTLPVRLDADALDEARGTLVRWRRAVADWARQPSRAIPEDVRGQLRAAWENDLDMPGVLRVLHRVETSELPEGARFETFAYADRLLGLELTRDLGSAA